MLDPVACQRIVMTSIENDQPSSNQESPPAAAVETAASQPNTVKRKVKPSDPHIETVASLIRAVYGGTFKRVTLKKAELNALRSSTVLTPSEREELLALAQSDRTLEKTRQMMLLCVGLDVSAGGNLIREFVGGVLQQHPAFVAASLADVLRNLPDSLSEEAAVRALVTAQRPTETLRDSEPRRRKQTGHRGTHAVHCLLMWFWLTRGAPVERIHRLLQSVLWVETGRRQKTDADRLRALITTRDPVAAAITFGLIERHVLTQRQLAEAASSAEKRASARAAQLEERLEMIEKSLAEAKAESDRLANELRRAVEAWDTDKVHLHDDYERLRGNVLRRLKEEIALLDEGLHALRRDPPKIHVMLDHAERAIDGLKVEIQRLQGGG
jgi:hypothetical protein